MINPLISIVICTYNGELFLSEQLESIVHQTYSNLEIIILDDCSTDRSIEIINAFANQYAAIKFHRNEQNLGYVKNFEKGIGLCNGEFVALCDQDDIWKFDKIDLLFNHITEAALIYHDSEFINDDGTSLHKKLSDQLNMYEGHSTYPFFLNNCISGHSMMFRKSIIDQILPFNETYFHDWQIAIIATENGGIKYLDQPLVKYRQHQLSNTDFLGIKKKRAKKNKSINLNWLKFLHSKLNDDPYIMEIISCLTNDSEIKSGSRGSLFLILLKKCRLLFYMKKKNPFSKIFNLFKITFLN